MVGLSEFEQGFLSGVWAVIVMLIARFALGREKKI